MMKRNMRRLSVQPPATDAEHDPIARKFPMFVLPIQKVLQLRRLETHEILRPELVEWTPDMGHVIFCSQTWLSFKHVDNDAGDKLALLQGLLRRLVAGTLEVPPHWLGELMFGRKIGVSATALKKCEYVWLDIFSVPQANAHAQLLAISSIASYVNDSRQFLVLAGPWVHEDGSVRDVRAWCSRGWCRLEQLANAMSIQSKPKPVLVAQSVSDVRSHGPCGFISRDWFAKPVGTGRFTVDADRATLGPLVKALILARKQAALNQGDLFTFRVLHSSCTRLLEGTGAAVEVEPTLDEWMAAMRFRSPREGEATGLTPLFFAALGLRSDLIAALCDLGVPVDGRGLRKANTFCGLPEGMTPLHASAAFADVPDVVNLLLERGADPFRQFDPTIGTHALFLAGSQGHIGNAEVLMRHSPTLISTPHKLGSLPIGTAVEFGQCEIFEHFYAQQPAQVEAELRAPDQGGNSMCSLAVMHVGDIDTVRAVAAATVKLGASVDQCAAHTPVPINNSSMRMIVKVCSVVAYFSRRPRGFISHYAYTHGCPAIHIASLQGNLGAVQVLLAHDADPNCRSPRHGMTPLHLASMAGHNSIARALLDAGADADAVDRHGLTPAHWARRNAPKSVVQHNANVFSAPQVSPFRASPVIAASGQT